MDEINKHYYPILPNKEIEVQLTDIESYIVRK